MQVEAIIFDPNKIGIKISNDSVDSCYEPIIQSGGKYDIRVSVTSNSDNLSPDIVICSLGARYKNYCANISRTYMVDAPSKVQKTYATLIGLFDTCLEQMIPGHEFKDVYEAAKAYLTKRDPNLLSHLPKNFGSVIGLEFRDTNLLLNANNSSKFADGMILNLSLGLHNVPLAPEDKTRAVESYKKMSAFSLLIADTVRVQVDGVPEILTKSPKDFGNVSYNVNDKTDEGDEEVDEDGKDEDGVRRSGRRSKEEAAAAENAALNRALKQKELMRKKLDEARRRAEKGGDRLGDGNDDEAQEAKELKTYRSPDEYPRDINNKQIRADMDKEAVLVPINGHIVPFHISTIKNITMPEQDRASWLRINFYVLRGTISKDTPKNMAQLLVKHGENSVFVKELTFRSLDSRNLSQAFMFYQELRKRVKQREFKAEQEKDLV